MAVCGIVAIVSRPSQRPTPEPSALLAGLDRALALLGDPAVVADAVAAVDAELRGLPGVLALTDRPELVTAIAARLDQLDIYAAEVEAALADDRAPLDADDLERANTASIRLRDVLWAIRSDRLRTADAVAALAGRGTSVATPSRVPGNPASAVGHRPHGGARPRLRWSPRLRVGQQSRPRSAGRPEARHRVRGTVWRPAVPGPRRALRRRTGRVGALVRLQGGRRDRRAGRQHCGAAVADHRR